jgi:hypothetical protein
VVVFEDAAAVRDAGGVVFVHEEEVGGGEVFECCGGSVRVVVSEEWGRGEETGRTHCEMVFRFEGSELDRLGGGVVEVGQFFYGWEEGCFESAVFLRVACCFGLGMLDEENGKRGLRMIL